MPIDYLIVDDEPIAHDIIKKYAAELPFLRLKGQCYHGLEALNWMQQHSVDLIFLDIEMPKLKGLDFLKTLSAPPKIILTTAYQEYALEGYEHNVVDYLLKPFSFQRFLKAIDRINQPTPSSSTAVEYRSTIFVKEEKKIHQIPLDNILYLQSLGAYVKLFCIDNMIITAKTMQEFENELPPDRFVRIHKSYLIALKHLRMLEGNRVRIHEHFIPIGRTYKQVLLRRLQ